MDAALNGPFGRVTLGTQVLTIGRLPDNQLVISDAKTSSRHAEIRPAAEGYSITDLGSTNGTFVNDQRLTPRTPRELYSGDVIRIGDTTFTYEAASQVAPTVYADPASPQNVDPGYLPTVAAPPPVPQGPQGYSIPSSPSQPGYTPPPPSYGQGPPIYAASVPNVPNYVPTPQKKSRRGLWISLSVIGGLLLLSCIGCSIFVFAARSTPEKTLTTFCDSLQKEDYKTAYNQLATNITGRVTEEDFALAWHFNKVASCNVSNVSEGDPTSLGTISYVFANGKSSVNEYSLVDENGIWKINAQKTPSQT